ncbi:MAG TPA: hypothetical protein VHB25_19625 [Gemmatimonadaceae bacterium]|nr:hypothetical protein [Gemmatimonadaceae bacterium]
MARTTVLIVAAAVVAAGCSQTPRVEAGGDVAAATPSTGTYIPIGTTLDARLNQSLAASTTREGDQFTATTVDPVVAQDGETAIPAGATLTGHVTGVHAASVPGEQSVIRLDFDNLSFNGRSYPFAGNVASVSVANQPTSATSSTVRSAVTGAAAGAVLGAIVSGGDLSKIITGGLLGAAAGTVISLGTGGSSQAVIPAGSTMQVRATQPVPLR